ncbi:unnamed protein product [Calypogeia fissa]
MLGDSFSASTHGVLTSSSASRASAVFAGGCMVEASAGSSRVDEVAFRDLADCTSISSPMTMVAGITEAAATMMMRSPTQDCSGVFENSPISVLQGLGDEIYTPSPVPTGNSSFDGSATLANMDLFLNDASSNNSEIRTFGKPLISEESGVASWSGRFRRIERCRSSSESINICVSKDEEVGEVEAIRTPEKETKKTDEEEEPESPTTPCSVARPLVLECPDAPLGSRSKELNRQSSLNETKLLMTTHLKRSASIFMFDKHFEFLREIGRGSFSTVYEARDRRNGTLCAVKMSKRQFRGRDDREHYLREIQSVACLSEHVNVVKYSRSWQQASHFYIQMELCENGSLRNLLDSSKTELPEDKVWKFINQVASGLEHIHAQGVLHLDIKPENIFVDSEGVLKIGDFGLAVPRRLWEWEEGDGGYVAPELLREEEPGPAADMYSFGAMVYEWATHTKLPRSGPLREGRVELPETRSRSLENLVRALLNPNPSKRPTATEVIGWRRDD